MKSGDNETPGIDKIHYLYHHRKTKRRKGSSSLIVEGFRSKE